MLLLPALLHCRGDFDPQRYAKDSPQCKVPPADASAVDSQFSALGGGGSSSGAECVAVPVLAQSSG
jgi:hypothetical protein